MSQFTRIDPFDLLERSDKWYVGGGACTLFAPAFPRFLDTPGYWDEAYFADIRLDRLFAITLLDSHGKPVGLHRATRRWTPDKLVQIYTLDGQPGVTMREERVVTRGNTFASRLTLATTGARRARFHLLVWTMQQVREMTEAAMRSQSPAETLTSCMDPVRESDLIHYQHTIRFGTKPDTPAEVYGWGERTPGSVPGKTTLQTAPLHSVSIAFGADRLPDSGSLNLCETTETAPTYELSVFPEKFANGVLAQEDHSGAGWNSSGMLHMALHYIVEATPEQPDVLTVGASVALTLDDACAALRADMAMDVVAGASASWQQYFDSVPYLECSDAYIETYYWYRWYGLRLLTVDMQPSAAGRPAHKLPHPCIFEGIGNFRSHISYSAQCHMRETSWMHDPSIAMGSLENFLANQVLAADSPIVGFVPGHLSLWRNDRGFYHADWGAAALQVYNLTGDLNFVRRVYSGLALYAEYFDRVRDSDETDLYDILDQGETGQEYMSRYLLSETDADAWKPIRIKGVDASCYLYSLKNTLSHFASLLGLHADSVRYRRNAERTRRAIRERMWDTEAGLFKDLNPTKLTQSPYSAAVGFYPLLTDIATKVQLPKLIANLYDPNRFGTRHPLPACSVDDPYFSASAEWKGKRTNCPWNGRMWPMTSSHVADGLAHAARSLSPDTAHSFSDFFHRFVRTLFHDGDVRRPNCYEHYNPDTGAPSLYRGIDDYQHSWIVDLIIRHLAGIQPSPGPHGGLVIDPIPCGIESLTIRNVLIRGRYIDVHWGPGDGFVVTIDGVDQVQLDQPQCVELEMS